MEINVRDLVAEDVLLDVLDVLDVEVLVLAVVPDAVAVQDVAQAAQVRVLAVVVLVTADVLEVAILHVHLDAQANVIADAQEVVMAAEATAKEYAIQAAV